MGSGLVAESIQRRRQIQAIASTRDAILAVTQGMVAESAYFEALRDELRLAAIRVVTAPGDTKPLSVVQTAADPLCHLQTASIFWEFRNANSPERVGE